MKTRFCPSPTGLIHLGNARTALFNALLSAQSGGGVFLLRIEDTDPERSKPEYTRALQEDLKWLGCLWQEGPGCDGGHGPYQQSERQAIYDAYYEQLLEAGHLYPCFATEDELSLMRKLQISQGLPPRYDGRYANLTKTEADEKIAAGLPYVLRFRVSDDAVIEFEDLIKGPLKFLGKDIGDFIVRRQDGTPTFMFCNAVDDALMGVTHALRGEDHLTNTPRQLLIAQALELTPPAYGHFSLMTELNGQKLSKRGGASSLADLRAAGYLPLALLNYLARLSHRYEDEGFMDFATLSSKLSFAQFSTAPSKFDQAQLVRWQKIAVAALTCDDFYTWLGHLDLLAEKKASFFTLLQPNIVFPKDAYEWVDRVFADSITQTDDAISIIKSAGEAYFSVLLEAVNTSSDVTEWINALKLGLNIKGKSLFQPLRLALTGVLKGPELAPMCQLMGAEQINKRVQAALALCQ